MALDATVSGTSSNSYIDVAGADSYFATRLKTDEWDELGTTDKEAALIQSTRRLEQERYNARKTVETQALQFPRDPIEDKDGFIRPSDEIPVEVQYAQLEYALFLLKEDDRFVSDLEIHDSQVLTQHNLTSALGYQFRAGSKAHQLPENVKQFLRGIGTSVWVESRAATNIFR